MLALLTASCRADSGAGQPASGPAAPEPVDQSVLGRCDPDEAATPSPSLLLTRRQLVNAIRSLVGDPSITEADVPPDTVTGPFVIAEEQNVGEGHVDGYRRLAESVAERAVSARLAELVPCADSPAVACGRTFLEALLPRAFRRPPTKELVDELYGFFSVQHEKYGFTSAVSMTLQVVLQSPEFLYRFEQPAGPANAQGLAPLDAFSLASKLSFFLTETPPDDELLRAAQANELATPEQIERQARRLLATTSGQLAMASFFERAYRLEFDDISKGSALLEGLPEQAVVVEGLRESFRRWVGHLMTDGRGTLRELFTSDEVLLPEELASLDASGPRSGILTQPAVLAMFSHDHSSPVLRGVFVRDGLLCSPMPPPPANADFVVPDAGPAATTRERYEQIEAQKDCAGCHTLMHSIGFALEGYDALGRYRTEENGERIDDSGQFVGFTEPALQGSFKGPAPLGEALSTSTQAAQCLTKKLYWHAAGRTLDRQDACVMHDLSERLVSEDGYAGDLRELLVGIAMSERFQSLAVPQGS